MNAETPKPGDLAEVKTTIVSMYVDRTTAGAIAAQLVGSGITEPQPPRPKDGIMTVLEYQQPVYVASFAVPGEWYSDLPVIPLDLRGKKGSVRLVPSKEAQTLDQVIEAHYGLALEMYENNGFPVRTLATPERVSRQLWNAGISPHQIYVGVPASGIKEIVDVNYQFSARTGEVSVGLRGVERVDNWRYAAEVSLSRGKQRVEVPEFGLLIDLIAFSDLGKREFGLRILPGE